MLRHPQKASKTIKLQLDAHKTQTKPNSKFGVHHRKQRPYQQ